MLKILLDTNFLLAQSEFGIDIYTKIDQIVHEPHEFIIVEPVQKELEDILGRATGKTRQAAQFAKRLIAHKKLTIQSTDQDHADDALLALALKPGHLVATQDQDLKKRLKSGGCDCLIIRNKTRIDFIKA